MAFIRKQGKVPTAAARIEIVKKRASLKTQIDEFNATTETLFPELDIYDVVLNEVPLGEDVISDAEDDDPLTVPVVPQGNVEKTELMLPSTLPGVLPPTLAGARLSEIELREAQAEEALEGIRREICHKSYIYRSNVRLASNKKGKLRGYAALHAADRALRHHIRIYKQARWALSRLNAAPSILHKFLELTEKDLQPLKSIYMPNARGQSTVSVPWIWKIAIQEGSDSTYLNECMYTMQSHNSSLTIIVYRINWLRARAKKLRWQEEIALIPREMEWTVAFFLYKAKQWKTTADSSRTAGPRAYALRQRAMWMHFADRATSSFNQCRLQYSATQ